MNKLKLSTDKRSIKPLSNKTSPETEQEWFDEVADGLLAGDPIVIAMLNENVEFDMINSHDDRTFTFEKLPPNCSNCDGEHYWYQWDEGEEVTGVEINREERSVVIARCKIDTCHHRLQVEATLFSTNVLTFQHVGKISVASAAIPSPINAEFCGNYYDPLEGLAFRLEQDTTIENPLVGIGLGVANAAVFGPSVNLLCRY